MTPEKQKAIELVVNFYNKIKPNDVHCDISYIQAKQCAIICVKNEYNSNRELLFNLKSCGVIQSEKVYLHRIQELIDQEQKVINEINLL